MLLSAVLTDINILLIWPTKQRAFLGDYQRSHRICESKHCFYIVLIQVIQPLLQNKSEATAHECITPAPVVSATFSQKKAGTIPASAWLASSGTGFFNHDDSLCIIHFLYSSYPNGTDISAPPVFQGLLFQGAGGKPLYNIFLGKYGQDNDGETEQEGSCRHWPKVDLIPQKEF